MAKITIDYIMDIYAADLSPHFQRGLKDALEKFEIQKTTQTEHLVIALKQIRAFAESGDVKAFNTIEEIASDAIKSQSNPSVSE
jgi:hypothetical protein